MDVLDYDYDSGNKLTKVTDTGNTNHGFKDGVNQAIEYTYDLNGNLVSDANKQITSILYNHLNMPTEIIFENNPNKKIKFDYTAEGIKIKKTVTDGSSVTTTEYCQDFVYENDILKQFDQPEGYVEPNGTGYQYVYRLQDFWSNTRITYADDNNDGQVTSSEIRREQNYYPFGLEHKGYNTSSYGAKNNLKTYQKQEFTEDLGLNTHEWKYRMSDPAIGRFWQVDPLAEDYMYNSTYAFQENKMGMGIELEGLELAPVNPIDMFNFEGGGKPTLTFGLHNIVLPTAERSTEGGVGAFVGNFFKSIWNGVANTWNASMNGANSGDMAADGIAELGNMTRRIEKGEATQEDVENTAAVLVMSMLRGKAGGNRPTIKQQASSIKNNLNGGKNSVHVKTPNGLIRYDLEGRTHGGVETPHKQSYKVNTNPNTGKTNLSRTSKKAEAMDQQDVRTVKKVLKKREQSNSNSNSNSSSNNGG